MMAMEHLLARNGYHPVRQLPTGEWAGVHDLDFAAGLFVGLDENGYRTQYDYAHRHEAEAALAAWDGEGDPPGPWIKQRPENRFNPGDDSAATFAGIWVSFGAAVGLGVGFWLWG